MTATILPFNPPEVTRFQQAVISAWGYPAPKMVRAGNKTWRVHGQNGISKAFTLSDLRRITKAILAGEGKR